MTNITYTPDKNGILYPDLTLPEEPTSLGAFAARRKSFMQKHRKGLFALLVMRGELNKHLAETEQRATEMTERLTSEMAAAEGVTEEMKETDQLGWVQAMNNILSRANEIVNKEVIYS